MKKSIFTLVVLITYFINATHSYAQEPPPEAFKACEGKSVGSRAEFTDPRGKLLKGFCENDDQGRIVLRPDRAKNEPNQQHHSPPPEAYTACIGKNVGEKSQFVSPRGENIMGICEEENGKRVLRPNPLNLSHSPN